MLPLHSKLHEPHLLRHDWYLCSDLSRRHPHILWLIGSSSGHIQHVWTSLQIRLALQTNKCLFHMQKIEFRVLWLPPLASLWNCKTNMVSVWPTQLTSKQSRPSWFLPIFIADSLWVLWHRHTPAWWFTMPLGHIYVCSQIPAISDSVFFSTHMTILSQVISVRQSPSSSPHAILLV